MRIEPPYRVLHVIGSTKRRGAELFAVRLADSLSERFESAVCSLFHFNDERPISVRYQIDGSWGWITARLGFNWHVFRKLLKIARDYQPHIIIAYGGVPMAHVAALKLIHREWLVVYRCIAFLEERSILTRVKILLFRPIVKLFNAIVCENQTCQQDFSKFYRVSPDEVTAINNGINPSLFDFGQDTPTRNETRAMLGLGPDDLALITVGSLTPEKNQSVLVSLVAKLRQRGIPARLMIAGGGPLRDLLEQKIASSGLKDYIQLLGVREDIPALLGAADLFLLPSKTEAMPGALIEAGLSGLPSVAFDVGGIKEVIQDGVTGLLVPYGDSLQLLKKVAALAEDVERRTAMGEAAGRRCRELFDMSLAARNFESLFLGLLDKKAPA
jgi:glycosyltransferase involved in cell wall biosynthesis